MDIDEAMAPVTAAHEVVDAVQRLRRRVADLADKSRGGIDINALENAVARADETARNALHEALRQASKDVTELG